MLRVKTVAEMFDVSPATIYRAVQSGQLRAVRMGTGRGAVRIPANAVEEFARACAAHTDTTGGAA